MFRLGEEKKFLMERTRQVVAVNALSTDNLFLLFSFSRPQSAVFIRVWVADGAFAVRFRFSVFVSTYCSNPPQFRFADLIVLEANRLETRESRWLVIRENPRLIRVPPLTHKIEVEFELGNNLTTMASSISGKFCSCANAITTSNPCFRCCPGRRESVALTALWWSQRRQHAVL